MNTSRLLKAAVMSALMSQVSGCLLDPTVPEKINESYDIQATRIDTERSQLAQFKHHKLPYVSGAVYEEPKPLPSFLKTSVYVDGTRSIAGLGLKYYADKISRQIDMPVRIGQDLYQISDDEDDNSSNRLSRHTDNIMDQADQSDVISPLDMKERLTLQGSAKQTLDELTAAFDTYWEYDNREVRIYKLKSETFNLDYLIQENETTTSVGSASSNDDENSSSGAGMSTSLTSTFTGATYENYQTTIKNMLSKYGSVSTLAHTGTIVVTDVPENLSDIRKFIDRENSKLTQEVALDVEVAQVTSSDGKDVAVVWQDLLSRFQDGGLSLTSAIPDLSSDQQNTLTGSLSGGSLKGSSLILRALAEKSNVRVLQRDTRTVVNNTPAQFRDIDIIEYPSVTGSSVDEGVITTSTEKGEIRPGFDMTLIPRITTNNRVIVNIVSTISRALPFDTVSNQYSTSRYSHVQKKEVKTTKVVQDGRTALVSGYLSSSLSSSKSGTGSASFWVLGGGGSTSKDRELLLIFITPHIVKKI